MLEWLKLSKDDCDKIVAMSNFVTMIGALTGLIYWIKSLRNFIKNLFMFFIIKPIKKLLDNILSWIREKIVGKENLELLKELEKLKGNKRAIEFLSDFNKEEVDGGYEALWIFTHLYSREMNFNEFKEAYERDKKDRKQYGSGLNVNKLRENTFEKLIKKYSK